ncbi:SGNH/GDSL hydrolase family protein [Paenibacillus naphthalenovorans]|uniref:SGNH/GDSL hydrolase family protein n=1 Tax=Paenibacillus naphthalenovorans TaxID=162209 RepID=UPI0008803415|nr:SGNH/GDSL hydrolase family protein [Paenibacillus naphthalenovorans]SDJ78569.1 Lysophospholipase L1 [Paenibacillus naphthalenovorans]
MKRQIYVIGDSISIQYGPYLEELLVPEFGYDRKRGTEQALRDLNVPVGANGGDSGMVLAYLQEQREQQVRYDVLLLNCGLHDMKTDPASGSKQIPLEQYRANMRRIADIALSMANQVFWLRTTPLIDEVHNRLNTSFHRFHRDVIDYNAAADAIMEQQRIPLLDLYAFTLALGPDVYCDHVHFKDEVRKQQAEFIARELRSRLQQS